MNLPKTRNLKWSSLFIIVVLSIIGCAPSNEAGNVDEKTTEEVKRLYQNLKKLAPEHTMFGHQDDLAYGVGWEYEQGRSDVLSTAGALPAVFGWDIGAIELGHDKNLDGIPFEKMREFIIEVYEKGGMNTISWHTYNPITKEDSWADTDEPNTTVEQIIPGGAYHQEYIDMLDYAADFFLSLQTEESTPVPVVFRPFHENNGSWFWWGADHSTPQQYKSLFQFTVNYLKNEKKVHNLLYAYSPDRQFNSQKEYLERYPGDQYVDIIGTDNYWDFTPNGEGIESVSRKLEIITQIAKEKSKVAAFTETGLEAIPDSTWWTGKLLPAISNPKYEIDIAWVLVWRNFSTGHHYAPYPGHPSEADFRKFKESEEMIFLDELHGLYN